jgi:hypothetical protein
MIRHWIFQATPEEYRIRDRLQPGQPKIITWRVNQHADEIKEGDRVFVWSCKADEPDAGLCGYLEILCDPIVMDDLSFELPFELKAPSAEPLKRVICRIVATGWITKGDMLTRKPALQTLDNLKRPWAGTNYDVDEQQVQMLKELLGVW